MISNSVFGFPHNEILRSSGHKWAVDSWGRRVPVGYHTRPTIMYIHCFDGCMVESNLDRLHYLILLILARLLLSGFRRLGTSTDGAVILLKAQRCFEPTIRCISIDIWNQIFIKWGGRVNASCAICLWAHFAWWHPKAQEVAGSFLHRFLPCHVILWVDQQPLFVAFLLIFYVGLLLTFQYNCCHPFFS